MISGAVHESCTEAMFADSTPRSTQNKFMSSFRLLYNKDQHKSDAKLAGV